MNELEESWLLWQLLDSGFPSGGFAHSLGLEAASQWGAVRGREELGEFVRASLVQVGRSQLPFVLAVLSGDEGFGDLDRRCDALLTSHVANRASRAQGQALVLSAQRIFRKDELDALRERIRKERLPGHIAPVFGAVAAAMRISQALAGCGFMFVTLRGLVSAAVRLGIVGPLDGQAIGHQLSPFARDWAGKCAAAGVDEAAQTAPVAELLGMTQDRLYSRLFQS